MKKQSGFTLVEVLVAVAIISIIFTTLASIVVTSLRNTSVNTKKIIGTHMADGLQEWIRGKKEDDWEDFTTRVGTRCFNAANIGTNWPAVGACSTFETINNFKYKRTVTISQVGNIYTSRIEFIWDESNPNNKVVNETYYSQW